MRETYAGSCHCGAVRFETDIDLNDGTTRCNCSMCTKTRYWGTVVSSNAFRLLQGDDALTEYQPRSATSRHRFCSCCGVKPLGQGTVDELGGEFYAVNVACLDDVTDEELAEAPITDVDGRHDAWGSSPTEIRYL
ncbi:GFA family protein [Natrononativus amylolyticus]|uniref:GFA family protein n=1 Tax=Natrononativus amylolyticus TaxID=2963434 RepID=UPI0020CC2B8C|nr:GFA family protein [Natrononativus amylolyticus]